MVGILPRYPACLNLRARCHRRDSGGGPNAYATSSSDIVCSLVRIRAAPCMPGSPVIELINQSRKRVRNDGGTTRVSGVLACGERRSRRTMDRKDGQRSGIGSVSRLLLCATDLHAQPILGVVEIRRCIWIAATGNRMRRQVCCRSDPEPSPGGLLTGRSSARWR